MSPTKRYGRYIFPLTAVIDFIVLNVMLYLVLHFSHNITDTLRIRAVFLCANVAYLPTLLIYLYDIHSVRAIHLDRIISIAIKSVFLHFCCFVALLYILNARIPTPPLIYFYAAYFVVFPTTWAMCRLALKHYRRSGYNYLRVIIVGTGENAERISYSLLSDQGFGYKVLGYFGAKPGENFKWNYIGTTEMLEKYVEQNDVDEIYFAVDNKEEDSMADVIRIAEKNVVKFHYVPYINKYIERNYELALIGSIPVLSLHPTPLSNPFNRFVKRTFDIVFSGAFLIISPIIFIPIAIAIKLSSPGPVFFKQMRTGYRGKPFLCWKFRTMKVNDLADKIQATENDPRKTKVGDFLRRSSLDELPQFINVFLGDMSVVGPRPHMLKCTEDYSKLIQNYMVRHTVKTGITGYAQVNGYRGEIKEVWQMERRVECDIWYTEHWSFLLDLKIIFRTITNTLKGDKNAY